MPECYATMKNYKFVVVVRANISTLNENICHPDKLKWLHLITDCYRQIVLKPWLDNMGLTKRKLSKKQNIRTLKMNYN